MIRAYYGKNLIILKYERVILIIWIKLREKTKICTADINYQYLIIFHDIFPSIIKHLQDLSIKIRVIGLTNQLFFQKDAILNRKVTYLFC